MIKKKLLLFLFIITACSNDESAQIFNVQKLRSNFIQQIETPATNNFIQNMALLNDKIITFSNAINKQNLEILKNTWKKAAISYSTIRPFNIGKINESFIYTAFYSWNTNEKYIENYIASVKPISKDEINAQPTNSRGLSAIEFLLFEKSSAEIINLFSNQRRIEYLKQLGGNLKMKSAILNSMWLTYRPKFIANNKMGINGSINLIVNQMNILLENIKGFKIGQPAGIEKANYPDAKKLQAEKSEYSLQLIKENLRSLKNIYFGKDNGLDDYVFSITKNKNLNTKINTQFTAIESAILEITTPLKTAILTNPTKVKALYSDIRKLLILIKTDVVSTLSITTTFSDNDGD